MNGEEAREAVKGNPYSFLHIDKAEIDLPKGTDVYLSLIHIYIAMFGMYFLAKGINSTKSKYFVFSMLFFGLGFYCYILSAIIIRCV